MICPQVPIFQNISSFTWWENCWCTIWRVLPDWRKNSYHLRHHLHHITPYMALSHIHQKTKTTSCRQPYQNYSQWNPNQVQRWSRLQEKMGRCCKFIRYLSSGKGCNCRELGLFWVGCRGLRSLWRRFLVKLRNFSLPCTVLAIGWEPSSSDCWYPRSQVSHSVAEPTKCSDIAHATENPLYAYPCIWVWWGEDPLF